MDFDIYNVLNEMGKKRWYFHNERDFQLDMALMIKTLYPDYNVRPEYFYYDSSKSKKCYIDIKVGDGQECQLIELKYRTKKEKLIDPNNKEHFSLQNHGAYDLGCYYVLSDLDRIEKLIGSSFTSERIEKGYSILLTNTDKYKEGAIGEGTLCGNYTLKDKRIIQNGKKLYFNIPTGKTKSDTCVKNRDEVILNSRYDIHWDRYGAAENGNSEERLYELVLEAKSKS